MSLWDRAALAFAGALVGALTLAGYVIASLAVVPRAAMGLTWAAFATPAGLIFIACCAVVGALCNPERLAGFFSVLWGTHVAWESPRVQTIGSAVVLLLLAVAVYYRAYLR